jgi:hypothetical protein
MKKTKKTKKTKTDPGYERAERKDYSADFAGDHSQHASEPTPEVVQAEKITTDANGDTFDPLKHQADEQGNPRLSIDGTFKKLRADARILKEVREQQERTQAEADANRERCRMVSRSLCSTFFGFVVSILGPEWNPGEAERKSVEEEAFQCALAYGLTLPPWATLAIAVGAYALPRTDSPGARKLVAKFSGKKSSPAPQSSSASNVVADSPSPNPPGSSV